MLSLLLGVGILIAGYFVYGKWLVHIVSPDDRPTPCKTSHDGVDFVELPHWKNMLIQLLNIAGVGPVIGVILGIKFGSIVFLIIPIGNVIAGATHDYIAGMMSIRDNGANLPKLIKDNLGKPFYWLFSVFLCAILLLVVAVFINIPAGLISGLMAKLTTTPTFWYAVVGVFIYYILATLFPIDKIIGRLYPIFGGLLIISTFAMFGAVVWATIKHPDLNLLAESADFAAQKWTAANNHPIIPLLFVTIACGIISGFHATQSPLIARTMKSERQGHSAFYGMMILEGIIAMCWAAAGMAIYNIYPELMSQAPTGVLIKITENFLGKGWGIVAILAVIALAITSGDTAMRSLRLSIAEILRIPQTKILNRIIICAVLSLIVTALVNWSNTDVQTFNQLWNYFSWGNQILAASTLMAATVWLMRQGKNFWVAVVPGAFMTYIVVCYILWISKAHGGPVGFGLNLHTSYWVAGVVTLVLVGSVMIFGQKMKKLDNSK